MRTYGEVARARGQRASGARRRATAWARNPVPVVVPCHRVVRTGGGLGGYTGGIEQARSSS